MAHTGVPPELESKLGMPLDQLFEQSQAAKNMAGPSVKGVCHTLVAHIIVHPPSSPPPPNRKARAKAKEKARARVVHRQW